jgi:hypothetical protein
MIWLENPWQLAVIHNPSAKKLHGWPSPAQQALKHIMVNTYPPAGVMVQNPAHVHNLLCRWTRGAFDVARAWRLFHLGTSLQVVEVRAVAGWPQP